MAHGVISYPSASRARASGLPGSMYLNSPLMATLVLFSFIYAGTRKQKEGSYPVR